jgi:hypothetical protein
MPKRSTQLDIILTIKIPRYPINFHFIIEKGVYIKINTSKIILTIYITMEMKLEIKLNGFIKFRVVLRRF